MAQKLAKRSLCSRDQVGAIIVDANQKVIGEGYNGPPKNFWHNSESCVNWCARAAEQGKKERDYSDCPSLHAEANALMMSDRSLRRGGTIYVTSHTCMGCAKLISNSGIVRVVVAAVAEHEHRRSDSTYLWLIKLGIPVMVNGVYFGEVITAAKGWVRSES